MTITYSETVFIPLQC